MLKTGLFILLLGAGISSWAEEKARYVEPAYQLPKVVYEFYLDDPAKMSSALYWVRALINPLTEEPYNMTPDFMDIKLVVHGSEIVTLAKKNYSRYRDVVERLRYYVALGVEVKVCHMAAEDFGYAVDDFYEFVELVPSAFTELVHWQQQGYALITPQVFLRTRSVDEIR